MTNCEEESIFYWKINIITIVWSIVFHILSIYVIYELLIKLTQTSDSQIYISSKYSRLQKEQEKEDYIQNQQEIEEQEKSKQEQKSQEHELDESISLQKGESIQLEQQKSQESIKQSQISLKTSQIQESQDEQRPLLHIELSLSQLNSLIQEVGSEISKMVEEELPAKIMLDDKPIEESFLGVDVKLTSILVAEVDINWDKVKFYDLSDNTLGLILKDLTIVFKLKLRIKPPLSDKINLNIYVTLRKASISLDCKVKQSKSSLWGVMFEAKNLEFQYKELDIKFGDTDMVNWVIKAVKKSIEVMLPFILDLIEPALNKFLRKELQENECQIQFLINEKLQQFDLFFAGGIQVKEDVLIVPLNLNNIILQKAFTLQEFSDQIDQNIKKSEREKELIHQQEKEFQLKKSQEKKQQ